MTVCLGRLWRGVGVRSQAQVEGTQGFLLHSEQDLERPSLPHPSPLLIATEGSIPMFCLQGVPDVPREPPDKAGLMRKFEK